MDKLPHFAKEGSPEEAQCQQPLHEDEPARLAVGGSWGPWCEDRAGQGVGRAGIYRPLCNPAG